MHCPGCGQQQVSDHTKFCSRCGMPLGTVAEVVKHGGILPQLAQLEQMNVKKPIFSKKNGVLFGVFWFIFFTLFSTAFLGIVQGPDELIALMAITGVFGAMMIIIGSLVVLPSSKAPAVFRTQQNVQPREINEGVRPALPPEQSIPANAFRAPGIGNWRDTNDLTPTSVTENTTRLLDKDEVP